MFPGEIDVQPSIYLDHLGTIFARFGADTQDSGNVSYGVQAGTARYFVKTAGDPANTDPYLDFDGRVALLRNAVADEDARNELARGLLREEVESAGFGAFAGVTPPRPRRAAKTDAAETRRKRDEEKRRKRERALRDELDDAEHVLATARGAERDATRARETAERAVEELRGRLERSAGD